MRHITMKAKYVDLVTRDKWQCHEYAITLRVGAQKFETPFYQGLAHKKEPDLKTVLSSLQLDARSGAEGFDDFCSELGYDPDSRKAEAIWKACRKTRDAMQKLLGDDFDSFMSAEYDS